MTALKKTPLHSLYAEYPGVRCIDFGGWDLPVQFSGIQKEHEAVRERAGLFDVSHMGEFNVTGTGAENFLQHVTTNDVSRLADGQAQYTLMCYPDGGVVDDLLVYKRSHNCYMLVVNASNIEKDWDWLQQHMPTDVHMDNVSEQTALLALQGPAAAAIMSDVANSAVTALGSYRFVELADLFGASVLVSRTGYTGEDGFEIYCRAEDAPLIWQELLQAGETYGLLPTGLGARDTLRFEAKLPLYGQELSATISPLEAGFGFFVKLDKGTFIGQEALLAQKEQGTPRKLVGLEMLERGIPRSHYPVFVGSEQIGDVTTGTQSPTLKRNLGLALIDSRFAQLGTRIEVDIRGKRLKAEVIQTPFYKRTK